MYTYLSLYPSLSIYISLYMYIYIYIYTSPTHKCSRVLSAMRSYINWVISKILTY